MRLNDYTLKLFLDRPRYITMQQVSKDTGLPYHWLSNYGAKRQKAPCVDKVQILYEYLTKDTARLNF